MGIAHFRPCDWLRGWHVTPAGPIRTSRGGHYADRKWVCYAEAILPLEVPSLRDVGPRGSRGAEAEEGEAAVGH